MKKKILITTLIITAIILTVIGTLFMIKKENDTKKDLSERVAEESITEEKEIDTTNWKTYRNDKYGFEMKYPPEYKPEELKNSAQNDYVSFYWGSSITFIPTNTKSFNKMKREVLKNKYEHDIIKIEEVDVLGKRTLKITSMPKGRKAVEHYFLHNGYIYEFDSSNSLWLTNTSLLNKMITFTK